MIVDLGPDPKSPQELGKKYPALGPSFFNGDDEAEEGLWRGVIPA
jgi:hypothetical protein